MTAVDVVVLTWNDDPVMLDAALDSALEQQSCAVRLFVVDNGSAPPAVVADERAQVLRQEENLGVGGGRNVGAARVRRRSSASSTATPACTTAPSPRCWRR